MRTSKQVPGSLLKARLLFNREYVHIQSRMKQSTARVVVCEGTLKRYIGPLHSPTLRYYQEVAVM